MPNDFAKAYPRKHFFLEMFTRDISLEDCILDLIDNSIDGLIRTRNIVVSEQLLSDRRLSERREAALPVIKVSFSESKFEIHDTCGGISQADALEEVFNFGHSPGRKGGALGVYGIGLKRAIFKIGNRFRMASKTHKEGFRVDLPVNEWAEKDADLNDWRIPITFTDGAGEESEAGTTITVTDLRPEVQMRLNDGVLKQKLLAAVSQTYALFLRKFVRIELNGDLVEPIPIPIGDSRSVQPARHTFEDDGVKVTIIASLAAKNDRGDWPAERAGWYALCNGRVVVVADKTELTGWGVFGAPHYHMGKHRGFVGLVSFEAKDALRLPWTTTKRGLNRESPIYQKTRNLMKGYAKPILSFLDSMYKGAELPEEPASRSIADGVKQATFASVMAKEPTPFVVRTSNRPVRTTVRVQFDAEKSDVERIRKRIRQSSWGANQIGKYTFEHFLKTECPQ